MISNTLTLLGMAALATAQSTTVSLFIPFPSFRDPQSLVASIFTSDSTATTYAVQCANSAAAASIASAATTQGAAAVTGLTDLSSAESACPLLHPFTVVQGPSTVYFSVNYIDVYFYVATIDCALSGTATAACTISTQGGSYSVSDPGTSIIELNGGPVTTTLTGDHAKSGYMPIVVTAGSATAKAGTLTGTSSSVATKGTNGAVAAAPVLGAGMLGAFGVAVGGAML